MPENGEDGIVKALFNVQLAGKYEIAITRKSKHVSGSPFIKTFKPGIG